MTIRTLRRRLWTDPSLAAIICVILSIQGDVVGHEKEAQEAEEPELRIRATTRVAFTPADILFVAEIRGGSDDYEPYYCTSVEWVWDDDTRSEMTPDCDLYEAGSSEIRRRFSMRHTFRHPGAYEVRLNLKDQDEVVASARTSVEVRGSAGFR